MKEIHEIREKFYEESKDLSHKQFLAKVRKEAEEAIKRYGLKFRRPSQIG